MPNGGSDNCGTCWFYSKNEDSQEDDYSEAEHLTSLLSNTRNPVNNLLLLVRLLIAYRKEWLPGKCTIRNLYLWKNPYYIY
jgi:hypothetical protein